MFYPLLSLKTNTWWVMGVCTFFSRGQELLASSNLNIHKSGGKTLGSVPIIRWSIMLPSPLLPALRTRPLRVCKILYAPLSHSLSLTLPYLLLPPSRSARQISKQLINEFNARIHAHIMCPLEKEHQGRKYSLERNSSCAVWTLCVSCCLFVGCHLSPHPIMLIAASSVVQGEAVN